MTPRQLFDWVSVNVQAAHFGYCSNEDYESEQRILDCFQQYRTIPGTRKLHSFVPSRTALWKSDPTQPQMLPGKSHAVRGQSPT